MRKYIHISGFCAAILALSLLVPIHAYGVESNPNKQPTHGVDCQDVSIPVSLAPALPKDQQLHGRYCQPGNKKTDVIQILLPGLTYDHRYWNIPGFNGRYSYTNVMNNAGYATLSLDRIGTGKSSRPPSPSVTTTTNAFTAHQAIQATRTGGLPGGRSYPKVIAGTHSYGTYVAWFEAALFHDIDGLIATGANHPPGAVGLGILAEQIGLAQLDPQVKNEKGLDPGYVTTLPASRGRIMHAPDNVDPRIVELDERMKSPDSLPALGTIGNGLATTPLVDVPSLTAEGQEDIFYCAQGNGLSLIDCTNSDTFKRQERPWWSPTAPLETYILPGSGHSMNLAKNAPKWYARALEWCQKYFPVGN